MPQSFVSLTCHVIFSTKQREPLLVGDIVPRLFAYIGGTLTNLGCRLIAAGGTADHVHLLLSLAKNVAVTDLVRTVKAKASGWIHEIFPALRGFAWQTGYGAFTVSYSNLGRVRHYIEEQAEHHRVRSFQEEFLAFLRRHGIEYDERYIWE